MWVLLVIISAVLFAFSNIIRKFVLGKEHPLEFLAARGLFTIFILLFLVPWVDTALDIRVLGLIFVSSLVASVGYYYQTKAQRHTDISILSPLQNLSPLFLLLIAYLFLGESITAVQFIGIIAIVGASYSLAMQKGDNVLSTLKHFTEDRWIHIWVSVLLLAIAVAFDKFLLGTIRPVTYMFFLWLFSNLNYIILNWWLYDWKHIAVDLQKGWHWLFIGALLNVVSMLCFYVAIGTPGVLVSLAFPLKRSSTLIETIFGGRMFHENNLVSRIVASIIMCIGIIFLVK